MREILFRGKKTGDNEFVYGQLVYLKNDLDVTSPYISSILSTKAIVKNRIEDGDDLFFVKEETVGQFTGLYDKNGQRIFEGDIIEVTSKYDKHFLQKFEVKFGECGNSGYPEFGYLGFYFDEIANEHRLRTDILYWVNEYECKVIGNIYDNPELIELIKDNHQIVS